MGPVLHADLHAPCSMWRGQVRASTEALSRCVAIVSSGRGASDGGERGPRVVGCPGKVCQLATDADEAAGACKLNSVYVKLNKQTVYCHGCCSYA